MQATLSHYRVLEEIGAGGMGVVYRAHDERLDRDVALKVLPAGALTDEAARKRLHKEACALSKLSHPNVATVFDFDTQDGTDFLVEELIPGLSLSEMLLRGPLSAREIIDLGSQLCEGLAAAHEQGILHRDLKPANVRVTPDARLKILDFGLARAMHRAGPSEATASLTETQTVSGTVPYMAPEQLLNEKLDPRTDLWAVGCVLYEMATGRRPFLGYGPALTDAILHQTPTPPSKLGLEVGPGLEAIILKCLEKDPSLRYQRAAEIKADLLRPKRHTTTEMATAVTAPRLQRGWLAAHWRAAAGAVATLAVIVATAIFFYTRPRAHALTEKDEILLADFVNTTGEPIFDGTLKTALAVKLGESPFLNAVSDTRLQDTLRLMKKPEGEKLAGTVAREACQRLNVKALLNSSIARLGSDYVITLEALNCQTGEVLAREQAEAHGQEEVMNALGPATSKLRSKLGESFKSVQRFDTPLQEATTSSLQALQAFTLGMQQRERLGDREGIPFFERAAELDPNFALAYHRLATSYLNMGEFERGRAYTSKAFALRERASERERYDIMAIYYSTDGSSGELDKAITICQLYKQSYPRDVIPYVDLGIFYLYDLGWPDKALAENRKALELRPDSSTMVGNLSWNLIAMNRYDEAAALLDQAVQKNPSAYHLNLPRYGLAFIQRDRNAMARWVEETRGTGGEPRVVLLEAQAKAFGGQLGEARILYRQAVKLGRAAGLKHLADIILEHQALVEIEFGNAAEAKAILRQIRDRSGLTAIALARAGETGKAQAIADERAKRFPAATVVQNIEIPLIRAAIALQHGRPANAADAIQPAIPHELATVWCPWWFGCNPDVLYLISETHLEHGDAGQATAAFQKLLDHRGIYPTSPFYPLAYVGLARARSLAGDTTGARRAYEQFFAIWKDADPDIPILQQAKAEYAKQR